jgi:DNA invertase Pin-like site-specific DNA recombinase
MLGVFAEFETALRRERQMEGVIKAKAKADTKADRLPLRGLGPRASRSKHDPERHRARSRRLKSERLSIGD